MRISRSLVPILLASCFSDPPPSSTGGSSSGDATAGDADDSGDGAGDATTMPGSASVSTTADDTGPSPGECGPAFECVVAPEGWTGPLIASVAPGEEAPPPCPPDSGEERLLLRALPPAAPQCGCECEPPQNVTCPQLGGPLSLATTPGTTCEDLPAPIPIAAAACENGTSSPWTAVALGDTVNQEGAGGSCAELAEVVIPPLQVEESVRVCGGGFATESCEDGGICAPQLPGVGGYRRCVVREGQHDCPTEFPELHAGFESYTDDRGCSACSCARPTSTCIPNLALYLRDDCNGLVHILGPGECASDSLVESFEFVAHIDGACAASGGMPQGGFTPLGVTTVCCEP